MKKFVLVAIIIAIAEIGNAQNVEFGISGSAMYSSKNASVGTGLIFSENPAVITQLNANLSYNKWGLLTSYSGYCGIQRLSAGDQYHLLDVFGTYKVNKEITLYGGPEFTYNDVEGTDNFGMGLVGMMTWSKKNLSTTLIYYTNPSFSFHYVIGSAEYRIVNNFSVYGLGGFTTAEAKPFYGMIGAKYSNNVVFCGVYYAFRKNAPGLHFNIGFNF